MSSSKRYENSHHLPVPCLEVGQSQSVPSSTPASPKWKGLGMTSQPVFSPPKSPAYFTSIILRDWVYSPALSL